MKCFIKLSAINILFYFINFYYSLKVLPLQPLYPIDSCCPKFFIFTYIQPVIHTYRCFWSHSCLSACNFTFYCIFNKLMCLLFPLSFFSFYVVKHQLSQSILSTHQRYVIENVVQTPTLIFLFFNIDFYYYMHT